MAMAMKVAKTPKELIKPLNLALRVDRDRTGTELSLSFVTTSVIFNVFVFIFSHHQKMYFVLRTDFKQGSKLVQRNIS
jgi:hypothetical protein